MPERLHAFGEGEKDNATYRHRCFCVHEGGGSYIYNDTPELKHVEVSIMPQF